MDLARECDRGQTGHKSEYRDKSVREYGYSFVFPWRRLVVAVRPDPFHPRSVRDAMDEWSVKTEKRRRREREKVQLTLSTEQWNQNESETDTVQDGQRQATLYFDTLNSRPSLLIPPHPHRGLFASPFNLSWPGLPACSCVLSSDWLLSSLQPGEECYS